MYGNTEKVSSSLEQPPDLWVIITFLGAQSLSLLLSSELVKQLEVSMPESLS